MLNVRIFFNWHFIVLWRKKDQTTCLVLKKNEQPKSILLIKNPWNIQCSPMDPKPKENGKLQSITKMFKIIKAFTLEIDKQLVNPQGAKV